MFNIYYWEKLTKKNFGLKIKFQKTEALFSVLSTDNNDINIFLSLENPSNFACERKDLNTHF